MADLDDTVPPADAGATVGAAASAFEPTVQFTTGSRPRGVFAPGPDPDDEPIQTTVPLVVVGPDGVRVPLDRVVIVGRRPTAPRVARGESVLITVPSPRREISGNHLELRPVGRTVVASDLRSVNGSIVTPAGSRARPLARGESLVVGAGTRLELGDGVVLRILEADPQRDDPPGASDDTKG